MGCPLLQVSHATLNSKARDAPTLLLAQIGFTSRRLSGCRSCIPAGQAMLCIPQFCHVGHHHAQPSCPHGRGCSPPPMEPWGSSGCAESRRWHLWGTLLSQNQQSQVWLVTMGKAHADPQSFPSHDEHGCCPQGGGGSSKAQHGARHKMAGGLGGEDGGPGQPAMAPAGWATSVVSPDPGVAPEELPGPRGRFLFAARAEASALQPPPALRFRQGLPPGAPLHYQLARCLFQDTVVKLCWAGAVIWGFLSCQPRRQIR